MTIRQGKILIVDDNEDILFTLKMLLRPRVENITTCSDPKEINRLVSRNQYDVILLDMNFTTDAVSGKEGFYWLERILEIAPDTVVILITAYSDTTIFCRSNGLVRSIESYRKVTGIPIPVLEIISVNYFLNDICLLFKNLEDKITIIPTSHKVFVDGQEITLTHKEYELLHFFMVNPGQIFSREQLLNRVWGYDFEGTTRTVDTHIKTLRQKLGDEGKHIVTLIRSGYKFEVSV